MGPDYKATFDNDDTSVPEVAFDSYTPRVAIITGGAQGIGYSIAQRFADDGIDVAINDIPAKHKEIELVVEELRKKGRRAIAVPGDMRSEADIISMIEKTVLELGSVDIVRTMNIQLKIFVDFVLKDGCKCGYQHDLLVSRKYVILQSDPSFS